MDRDKTAGSAVLDSSVGKGAKIDGLQSDNGMQQELFVLLKAERIFTK